MKILKMRATWTSGQCPLPIGHVFNSDSEAQDDSEEPSEDWGKKKFNFLGPKDWEKLF